MSRAEGFAAVPTWMIRDTNVSVYALMVFASLASRAGLGEIHPSQATLAAEARCSDRQVRRALIELEGLGVVTRERRKGAQGRAANAYALHPNGSAKVPDSQSATSGVPDSAAKVPDSQSGGSGLSEQATPLIEVENLEVENLEVDSAPSFDDFWAVWPRKDAKKNASTAWSRAVKRADPQRILAAARAYATHPARPEKQFVPYAATWLNGDRWDDPLPDVAPPQTFARQRQNNALALVGSYRDKEQGREEVGSGAAAGLQALDRGW